MKLVDAALSYLGHGLSVIPDKPRDKKPDIQWEVYQHQRASEAQVKEWWREKPRRNVGVVCGLVSNNLISLDFDAMAAFQAYCERFPDLLSTRIHLTGSGKGHHAFYYVSVVPESHPYQTRWGRVEVKGNGTQVVFPPSIHPSGNPYSVFKKDPALKVTDLAGVVNWLVENPAKPFVQRPTTPPPRRQADNLSNATTEFIASGAPKGTRNETLFRAACDLAGNGYTYQEAENILLPSCARTGYDRSFTERSAIATIASAFRKPRIPARPERGEALLSRRNTTRRSDCEAVEVNTLSDTMIGLCSHYADLLDENSQQNEAERRDVYHELFDTLTLNGIRISHELDVDYLAYRVRRSLEVTTL